MIQLNDPPLFTIDEVVVGETYYIPYGHLFYDPIDEVKIVEGPLTDSAAYAARFAARFGEFADNFVSDEGSFWFRTESPSVRAGWIAAWDHGIGKMYNFNRLFRTREGAQAYLEACHYAGVTSGSDYRSFKDLLP